VYAATIGHLEGLFERHFRRYADRATVISTYLARRLRATGYPEDRILLQRLGCDTRRFKVLDKGRVRDRLGLPRHEAVLCYVGALPMADMSLLFEALQLVLQKVTRPPIVLMVGTPSAEVQQAKGIELRWIPRQPLDQVHEFISASDLCLLPAQRSVANLARWPSKCGDYFNAGRPVIATPVGDLADLFADHRLGFIAKDATAPAFATAIMHALDSSELWQDIGQSCRQFAENHLDVRRLAAELLTLYGDASSD
jgi:glycosyltransferase involved in cell wall biosynthesis